VFSKVFINNRRVLKPKTSHQLRVDSPSNIKPSTPDKLVKSSSDCNLEILNSLSEIKPDDNAPGDTVKSEKIVNNVLSDNDVNDLIFEKVQDFENNEASKNKTEKTELASVETDKASINRNNSDQNLKIEIVGKRKDNCIKPSTDRKNEASKPNLALHNTRMENMKGVGGGGVGGGGHMNINNEMSSMHQTFGAAIMTPGVDASSQLLNHFPTTTQLVTSVQQQFLNNAIPINAIEPMQWPLMNSIYNNMPLHSLFGAAMNPTTDSSNWINNGINISPHPIIPSRILTKEEFYERQRKLRAEK